MIHSITRLDWKLSSVYVKTSISGPLMYMTESGVHVLVGVVSYGPNGCIDPTLPTVYARVTEVLNWIFSVLKTSAKTCLPVETDLKARLVHYWTQCPRVSSLMEAASCIVNWWIALLLQRIQEYIWVSKNAWVRACISTKKLSIQKCYKIFNFCQF